MIEVSERAATRCLLCIDPDRTWLNLMTRELKSMGINEVLGTTKPKEALTCIRDDDPDILITHYEPKLINFLRHSDVSPAQQIPIIVVTGNLSGPAITEMRDAGVNEIAAKPCAVATLVERIEAIVSHPREFIVSETFIGPSRRRKNKAINGPDRRVN